MQSRGTTRGRNGRGLSWFVIVIICSLPLFEFTSAKDGNDFDIVDAQRSRRPHHQSISQQQQRQVQQQLSTAKGRLIKQRNIQNYSPTYEIVNTIYNADDQDVNSSSQRQQPELSLLKNSTTTTRNGNYTGIDDFQKNLATLRNMVRAKQLDLRADRKQTEHQNKTLKGNLNVTLEEDINTINVLIGMLMLANKRLVEQRDKTDANSRLQQPVTVKPEVREDTSQLPSEKQTKLVAKDEMKSRKMIKKRRKEDKRVPTWPATPTNKTTTTPKPSQSQHLDLFMVKPGFGGDLSSDEDDKTTAQSRIAKRQFPAQLVGQQPIEYHNSEEDLIRGHQPLVAHDLLNVRRQQQPAGFSHPFASRPENMFVSRPMIQNPLYEHLQRAPMSEEPIYPPLARPGNQMEENTVEDHEQQQKRPLVPPYNGHSLEWTPQSAPLSQRLGDEPLYHPLQPTGQPQPIANGINDAAANQPFINPIHQMLMAAKNQQEAALAYERRRLEHEMELQKRQEQMKKQHEEFVERQRQQAEANNNKAQKNGSQEQSPASGEQQHDNNSSNNEVESGDEGNSDSNGNEQPAEEQNDAARDKGDSGQKQAEEDPDLKGFQNFAGDTDFTDLFPPGILSDSEIKEMKKQQEDQKKRQEQEEQEQQERQQQQQGEQQDEQEGQHQPEAEGGNSKEESDQQLASNVTATSNQPAEGANVGNNGNKTEDTGQQPQRQQPTLPGFIANTTAQQQLLASQTNKTGSDSHKPAKTRRSHTELIKQIEQPYRMAMLDSEYHDRYVKPFLAKQMDTKEDVQHDEEQSEDLRGTGNGAVQFDNEEAARR